MSDKGVGITSGARVSGSRILNVQGDVTINLHIGADTDPNLLLRVLQRLLPEAPEKQITTLLTEKEVEG